MSEENLNASRSEIDWWDKLSEYQKQNINEGIKDVEEGRVVSSEIFWERLRNG
ncbi:MAG: hypothetical protein JWQ34_1381 [Mucilaginibacter sp.]|uniref:hypothetical protein n=1 Tax=Mucilaginibacter sp. TaxID=1882438 RepID=UPI002610AA4E|nr:hypothetical protein [Mucilaginibacter sp.]MDB5003156.1 hypothetical protein [Mucilaginibacter sp.]